MVNNDNIISLNNYDPSHSVKPEFFNCANETEKAGLLNLIKANPGIHILDEIDSQLKELVKLKNPKLTLSAEETEGLIAEELNGSSKDDYGVWVYYPWSRKLIHILSEKDFIAVRTNRNQYKLTVEEQTYLSDKTIGVVGLSVGQSISLTLAMERIFGEIRLADFDELELSNLNRIRTGIFNLGLPKVVIAAREIAEIDPFLNVTIFPKGLTEENMEDFFHKGGDLDILVDECDGLEMKILARIKAKSMGIPVIMDTSDRGMFDVERFDLEPDRPIMHGLVEDLDLTKIKDLTNEEKIPYIMPMVGFESISKRLKASMMEVKQTINTWPQLASSVALGGALGTDVCRRIFLKEFNESGRYYVDLDELIADKDAKIKIREVLTYEPIEEEKLEEFVDSLEEDQGDSVSDEFQSSWLKTAIKTPNFANHQPWIWKWKGSSLYLFFDAYRSSGFTDWEFSQSYMELGGAIHNLCNAAAADGYTANVDWIESEGFQEFIASISFEKGAKNIEEAKKSLELLDFRFSGQTLNHLTIDTIHNLSEVINETDYLKIDWITEEGKIEQLEDLMANAQRFRILNSQGHFDFYRWVRWSKEDLSNHGDGILVDSLLSDTKDIGPLKFAEDWEAINYLEKWDKGFSFKDLAKRSLTGSDAYALISISDVTKVAMLSAGDVVENLWLKAVDLGVNFQPIGVLPAMYNRALNKADVTMSANLKTKITKDYKIFNELFPSTEDNKGLVLIRFLKKQNEKETSVRLPINQVLY